MALYRVDYFMPNLNYKQRLFNITHTKSSYYLSNINQSIDLNSNNPNTKLFNFEETTTKSAFYFILQFYNTETIMLGNDSQIQFQGETDNEFLPNNSNSYESIIKEHQQRRSHILNDHLIFDPQESSHIGRQFLSHQSEKSGRTAERKALEQNSNPFPQDQQQNEQNQFLVNEENLAASIKHALQSVNSKHNYSGSIQFEQNSINKENDEEELPHFGGLMGASILDKSNIENGQEESQLPQSNEGKSKNQHYNQNIEIQQQSGHQHEDNVQQQSDPFRGVQEQSEANPKEQMQSKLELNQIEQNAFLPNHSNNFNLKSSVQKQNSQNIINIQKDSSSQKNNLSAFDNGEKSHMKSRSQIQALQSVLQSSNSKIKKEDKAQQPQQQQHQHQQSNPFIQSSQHSIKARQQLQDQNSLSRLVHQNLYEKQYQQAQKANSSQFVVINRIISSEVEVFQIPTINKMGENSSLKSQPKHQNNIHFGEQSKQSYGDSQSNQIFNSPIPNQSINAQKQSECERLNMKQDKISQKSIIDKYDFCDNNIMHQSRNNSMNDYSANEVNKQSQQVIEDDCQKHCRGKNISCDQKNIQSVNQSDIMKSMAQNSQVNQYNINQSIDSARKQQQPSKIDKISIREQQTIQQFDHQQKIQNQKQASSFLQVNKSISISSSKNAPSQKISVYKQKTFKLNSSKLSLSKKSVNQNIKLRNNQPYDDYSQKSSRKQAIQRESQLHLPYIQNKRKQSELLNGLKASGNFSKQSPSIKIEQGSQISSKSSKYSVQSKHHSSKIQKHQRDKIVSYSQGVSNHQDTRIYLPQMQQGSTGIDSKSTFTKKKQQSNKEIFNTYPATFQVQTIDQIRGTIEQTRKNTQQNQPLQQDQENMKTVGSPSKQRESQIQRVRALKESHRKRLQRQLQKVKKQLEEINSWEKNMEKIYEEKQRLQNKQKQKSLILKEKQLEIKKNNKFSRQNQVILKIIKDHRKSKQQIVAPSDNAEDLTKNIAQLVNLRNQAQQKQKEQKRQQITQRMKRNESRKLQQQKLIKVNNHIVKQFKSVEGPVQSPNKNLQPKIDKINIYKGSKYQGNIRAKANPYEQKLD